MSLKYKHTLLLVDDEGHITKALLRLLRREGYEILCASSGPEGLEKLKAAEKPVSLIISDQRMPGMNGAEFLEKAKAIFPHAIRILLTGYSDMDALVDAVNKGEIHRYFAKPWNDEDLLLQVRQSLEQYELFVENRRLLALTARQNKQLKELNEALEEKVAARTEEIARKNKELTTLNEQLEANLYNTVRAFASLVETHTPAVAGHGRRVGTLARRIAEQMGLAEEEVTQVEIAGLLHDIGKLGLPARLLDYQQDTWSSEEKALYRDHPKNGQATVHFINKLDHAGLLIRSHHEQFDGHGYPDELSEEEIPLGSRIIAVANAYDKIVNLRVSPHPSGGVRQKTGNPGRASGATRAALKEDAAQHLKRHGFTWYDPDIIKIFLEMLKAEGAAEAGARWVSLEELRPGMVLKKSLYSSKGRFLIPSATILSADMISKLKAHYATDLVCERICVATA
ncbi:MAG: response regulator [Deltaproteobacteria bacterium]|nr:response regulator [Deltaproteobacteria bacterium]